MSTETASISTMAQDVGSSMSYMWIQAGRLDLFIIAAPFFFFLFLSLAGLLERAEAPGGRFDFHFAVGGGGEGEEGGGRWGRHLETSTHLCLQPSVCNSAI